MNRSNRLKNKNSRRFSFSNILAKEVLLERMEDRIVPAYVSGDFGWAASIDSTQAVVDPGYAVPWGNRNSALATDSNGNSYIAGYYSGTVDFDPSPTNLFNMISSGGTDGFIEKFDSEGKFVWAKSISGTSNEAITTVKVFTDGSIIIGGRFSGSIDLDPSTSQKLVTSQGGDDAFIVKLDSSGALEWANTLGGSGNDEVQAICIDLNQKLLVSGKYNGTVDFDPTSATLNLVSQTSFADLFVSKWTGVGSFSWAKAINGNNLKNIYDMTTDSTGNVLITGEFQGTVDPDPSFNSASITSGGSYDGFLIKLDSSGGYKWNSTVSGVDSQNSFSVTTDSTDNVYVGGGFTSPSGPAFFTDKNGASLLTNIAIKHVGDTSLDSYLVSNINMKKYSEWQTPPLTYWGPKVNDSECSLTYKFNFSSSATRIYLKTTFAFWNFDVTPGGYGKGKGSLWGSKDGINWTMLQDNPYPANGSAGPVYASDLPSSLLGNNSIWIQMRFFVSGAPNSSYTVAQFGRGDANSTNTCFELRAESGGVTSKSSQGDADAFVQKLSSDGNTQWISSWGGSGWDGVTALTTDASKNLYVAGRFNNTVDFDPSPTVANLTSKGDTDIYLSKLLADGSLSSIKIIGSTGHDELRGLSISKSGLISMTGVFNGTMDFDTENAVSNISSLSGTNSFITQWNRQLTKTSLSISDNIVSGNTILTAKIQKENNNSSTGTVTFTDFFEGITTTLGTSTVENGFASLALSTISAGVHNYSANYSGDSNSYGSKSNAISKFIEKSSILLTSSSSTSTYGGLVVFNSEIVNFSTGYATPTGSVKFYDGKNLIGSSVLKSNSNSGFSVYNLSVGIHSIRAVYSGDSNFGSSISSVLVQTVKVGSPALLSIIKGDIQSTTVATAFGNLLQVLVTDEYGNPINNSQVTFSINSNKASGVFEGLNSINTNVNGYALAPKLTANSVAGTFTVTASVTGLQNVVFNLTNLPGAASKVVTVSGSNQSTTVNTAFAAPLVAKVTDTYSNPISGVQVTFNAPGDGAFALLSGPTTVTSNSDGLVTSPSLVANTVSGSYNVIASAQNLTSAQFLLTNKSGQASSIAKQSGNNQATTVNTSFANPISVKVSDSFGNPVSGVNVVFSGPTTGAGIFFTGTSTVTTNAQGLATPTGIKANTIVGIYNVQAYVNDQLNTTYNLTNLAGAASKLVLMGGNNQSAVVNTAYAAPIQLIVTDTFGNVVSNSPITFTAPSSGAGIIVTGSNQAISGTDGMASWSAFIANKIAGSFNVTASLSGGAAYNLNLTNNPGAVSSLVPVSGNNQSAVINGSFPIALQVKVLDIFGNAVPNVPVAFTSPTTGASAKFTGATSANSDNSGVAILSGLGANGVVGSYSVTATATGATNATFALRNAAPTVQSLMVQQSSTGRSFVRYVDLNINDAVTVNTLVSSLSGSAPKIRITNTGLDGKAKTAVVIKGLTKASGNLVKIDFGTKGIGGNAATNVGDGSYLIEMDLDGNGSFESSQRFFRLLGDVNGDKVVDAKDTALVKASLNKSGSNLPADTNGDGKVNASDTSYVARAQRRRITV